MSQSNNSAPIDNNNNINNKLNKTRSKCKNEIIENRQVHKRKRRRRQISNPTDINEIGKAIELHFTIELFLMQFIFL